MKKILLCIIICLLLCSCGKNIEIIEKNSINYNLSIGETFDENIVFSFENKQEDVNSNELEESGGEYSSLKNTIINDNIHSLYYDGDKFYKKVIDKKKNVTNVEISYNYIEDEFIYSNLIMSCFENYEINSKDDYFEINLMGKFGCLDNMDKVDINIKSEYDVIDSNGEIVDNRYHWVIDKNNEDFTFISFKIARDYNKMSKEIVNNKSNGVLVGIIKIISLVVVIFILYKLYLKLKLKMDF